MVKAAGEPAVALNGTAIRVLREITFLATDE
jgi:hypothetical protein